MCKNLNFWYIFYHSAIWADHRMVKGKVFMSSQSFNFGTAMGNMMMKQQCWACTAGGAHKCEKFHFAFSEIFYFLGDTCLWWCFTKVEKSESSFYCTTWSMWWLKTGMECRNHIVQVLPVAGCSSMGPSLHSLSPLLPWPLKDRNSV